MTFTSREIALPDEADTDALAMRIADLLEPGDTILLHGPIGSGKSHFARALIRHRLGNPGEDVPSPTFTIVQTYPDARGDIWHCDLYRLGGSEEIAELGLEEAFVEAICLIEWPDRLGEVRPEGALNLRLAATPAGHLAVFSGPDVWQGRLDDVLG
ncbi:tRNA (adenosine(37)-N6)-threonylcarbamoyltransferase complex ATPase subunit type 1 TsaE [Ponticoccus sp. SC2-23]|uniref:tRNA (adenosine(37)-N6)-threonylcarbamoyltransferase complex ATPase subunit type 1 TsaE n=1 Tax=Alexandriicola marinus TaxID=2081710 RepID=UPI000FDB0163|nr:tRNA (adenosine(37)-N6)-threonylcarbamoyltransferase complex ATPase subunit type 1 TsaE [Alexandriicola marinus]MBM1220746.1 tRNA (adenosine(37)-N6)-threonylcarbamoyltransferase complex ATPase subunit type 1 TsaE [Ponticoccus sp. SC6-9]MBM1226005.1 tRNA (adenosine(37)-N6)-threonylcarbamoyltransferase complex ATPase subunit type 1 TsaE [Ponticoccus sp. SC6-15]MBM1231302.1 tRNA (adenosine(37)-N6)-threonylcarbamoyltransferase complex ATPase subunit type 1 TsaE [Ponticoccus sp. SC6-38]MBM1235837